MFATQMAFIRPLMYSALMTGCLRGLGETWNSICGYDFARVARWFVCGGRWGLGDCVGIDVVVGMTVYFGNWGVMTVLDVVEAGARDGTGDGDGGER